MDSSSVKYADVVPHSDEDTDTTISNIINGIKSHSPGANTDMIFIAYNLAKAAHRGQLRRSGAEYIEHPVQIAYIAYTLSLDVVTITSALLHDVVEDTPYTLSDIKSLFGTAVADIVDGVTKLKKLQYNTHEEQQVENLRKMFLAMAKDIRVVVIKLIDRLHNMRTLEYMSPEKQLEKAKEVLEVYAPLAHRLGMSKIKSELEDLSLKYLDPVAYEEIRSGIKQKRQEREDYISGIIDTLKNKLHSINIKAEVTGRAKHFYSIFRKMYGQNKTLDEIYDLFAVRVIVDSVADCYAVLGMVHENYTPVPGRFKDYIAMPKPNMYQSLHTTVIGANGAPFEIQIRTWDMHKVAEEGIAAHWKYKEGVSGQNEMDSKLEWVRQLLETQVDIIDTDDFLNTLKIDLFADEVFVFTPQGRVVSLPAESSVIDFAFAIHSEVGYKMVGAKVNGKIVPNHYKLKNGEIIEILTSSANRGPSRDWLKIVRTSQAKNKINQWFKRECRDENIEHGKDLIDKEIRRLGYTHAQLFREKWLEPIMRRYSFITLDDLYASVGYGGLTAQKIVMRLREEFIREKKEKEKEASASVSAASEENRRREHVSSNGIIVRGIDNCLVRLARCCRPVPGDDIVGFITKGRGVSVHRADCPNIQLSALPEEDKERFIGVEWADSKKMNYVATIEVHAADRGGIIFDIGKAVSDMSIPCRSINGRVKKGAAIIELGLEISDTAVLDRAIKKLYQMPEIISVKRKSH